MSVFLEIAIELIAVHTLDRRVVYVNPEAIVQLAEPKPEGTKGKLFVDAVRCIIGLPDGKYVSVRETCDEVRRLFIEDEP